MATRRYNGHKHHSRKSHSNEQTQRRRLSKQEEIDLTSESIDCNDKTNHMINGLYGEVSSAPTIHVNSAEEKNGQTPMVCPHFWFENGIIWMMFKVEAKTEISDSIDLNESNQSITKTVEELGKSFALKLNVTEKSSFSNLSADDIREKKVFLNLIIPFKCHVFTERQIFSQSWSSSRHQCVAANHSNMRIGKWRLAEQLSLFFKLTGFALLIWSRFLKLF